MSHRAAAVTAAILAPLGAALAMPVVTLAAGVPDTKAGVAAQAAVDANPLPTVAVQAGVDNAQDDQADETSPEDGDQQTPAAQPAPASPTPAPTATPAPAIPELPPKPQDTLEDSGDSVGAVGSNGNSAGNSNNGGSSNKGSRPATLQTTTTPQRLSVLQSTTRVVSDTGAIPRGGVQAGGGGTALTAHGNGPNEGALGAAAGLVLLVTGTGLVLRRRLGTE